MKSTDRSLDRVPLERVKDIHLNLMLCDNRHTKFVCLIQIIHRSTWNDEWSNMAMQIYLLVTSYWMIATVSETAKEQQQHALVQEYFLNPTLDYPYRVDNDVEVVMKNNKLTIPKSPQWCIITWYHQYFQHPGFTKPEETLKTTCIVKACELPTHVRCARLVILKYSSMVSYILRKLL